MVRYLAADLTTLLDPLRPAHEPPFPCSRCGSANNMKVGLHSPALGDYGALVTGYRALLVPVAGLYALALVLGRGHLRTGTGGSAPPTDDEQGDRTAAAVH